MKIKFLFKPGLLQIMVRELREYIDALSHAHKQHVSIVGHLSNHGGEHRSTRHRTQASEADDRKSTSTQAAHVACHHGHFLVQFPLHFA